MDLHLSKSSAIMRKNVCGAERMAYGTDFPLWDPVTQVERFLQLKLPPEQMESLAWKTAKYLLHL